MPGIRQTNSGVVITSGGVAQTTAASSTLTWETASDWDNAAEEQEVYHPAGTLQLLLWDEFDDGTLDTDFWTWSTQPQSYDEGSTKAGFFTADFSDHQGDAAPSGTIELLYHEIDPVDNQFDIYMKLNNPNASSSPNDQKVGFAFKESDGTNLICVHSDEGGDWFYMIEDEGNNWEGVRDQSTPVTDEYMRFRYDGTDLHGYYDHDTTTAPSWTQFATKSWSPSWPLKLGINGNILEYHVDWVRNNRVDSGPYLLTPVKSFSSDVTPDLQNLSYSLNGESIDLDVIGSPGTASEEVITQTLDGATSYSLSWSNGHTDFRLRPRLSTADPTTTPTFSKGELVG